MATPWKYAASKFASKALTRRKLISFASMIKVSLGNAGRECATVSLKNLQAGLGHATYQAKTFIAGRLPFAM
jgi:hypothetical protein